MAFCRWGWAGGTDGEMDRRSRGLGTVGRLAAQIFVNKNPECLIGIFSNKVIHKHSYQGINILSTISRWKSTPQVVIGQPDQRRCLL